MWCFAFDVDHTLEVNQGPIEVESMRKLHRQGHIVGLCGNWEHFIDHVPDWRTFIRFYGPDHTRLQPKHEMLQNVRNMMPMANAFIMVGNDPRRFTFPVSNDIGAASLAGWGYVAENAFADWITNVTGVML
jgi:hypothetical protein